MSLAEKRAALIEDLTVLPDNDERYRYLLVAGRRFPPMESNLKSAERLLPGCVSQLWLYPQYRDGCCYFQMDADAQITKGIAAIVCNYYGGETPADIVANELDFLAEAGVAQLLSPNRSNGLASLRRYIKAFAQSRLTPSAPAT